MFDQVSFTLYYLYHVAELIEGGLKFQIFFYRRNLMLAKELRLHAGNIVMKQAHKILYMQQHILVDYK